MTGPRTAMSLIVIALALGGVNCARELDHFRVHEVQEVPVNFEVRLTDQLDTAAKEARLDALTHFANPSRKVHPGAPDVGIKDGNRHLTWYSIEQEQPEPRRTVRFRNQFGDHSVDIREPRFLLVPAQKTSDPNSQFPEQLDHYKCYRVSELNTVPALPAVTVGDQFGSQSNAQVGEPRLFCIPAKKERPGEEPEEIVNAVDHLAVYDLTPLGGVQQITIRDQFGPRGLNVRRSVMLAVPTEKLTVVAHDD